MANYIVSGKNLTAVANAIRTKGGTSSALEFPDGFVQAIGDIQTGGSSVTVESLNVTQNGTYTAPSGKAYSPVTVNVSGGSGADTLEQRITNTLTSYTNSNVTTLSESAFRSCTSLANASFPNLTTIMAYCFQSCIHLTSLSAPNVTKVGGYAFNGCTNLETLSIGTLSEIGSNGFRGCTKLSSPIVLTDTRLQDYTFYGCQRLPSVTVDNVTTIYSNAFQNCKALTSISLPSVTSMSSSAFNGCTNLTSVSLNPNFEGTGGTSMFANCANLEVLDLKNIKSIGTGVFENDAKLATLVLRKSGSICTLANTNAFNNTPFASSGTGGTLYVPQDLIASYQSANRWSTILGYPNNQIKAIEGSAYE